MERATSLRSQNSYQDSEPILVEDLQNENTNLQLLLEKSKKELEEAIFENYKLKNEKFEIEIDNQKKDKEILALKENHSITK